MDEEKIAEGATRGAIRGLGDLWDKWKNRKIITVEPKKDVDFKKGTKILFIDDEEFEYIDLVREAGWNASQIHDIKNPDDETVKSADIIFLDYIGVGQSLAPTNQGLGLLKFLKDKYPEKTIIFYSAHAGFTLGDEFNIADDWLYKGADAIVFLQKIEEHARKRSLTV